jgi:hypothetical protein
MTRYHPRQRVHDRIEVRAGILVGLLCSTLLLFCVTPVRAAQNFLHNGDLTVGSGDSVDGWRTEAWVQDEGTTEYHWVPPQTGAPGEIEVLSHRDNDARWQQPLSLGPGWYHITADARTHGVLDFRTGANISVLDGQIVSPDLRGDTDWTRLGFYLKVGPHGADVDVCLRLGGFGNLTRGQAFFRNPRVEAVSAPPPGADYVFDLTAVRNAQLTPPIGKPWTLWATFLFLAMLAAVGWWLMGEPLASRRAAQPVPDASEVAPRRKRARAR